MSELTDFMDDPAKKNLVWCDVCGMKKSYEKCEDALLVSKAHKNGQHGVR